MSTREGSLTAPLVSTHVGSPTLREVDLDMVRGLAILLAMGWHFNQNSTPFSVLNFVLLPGRVFGWAGVDLFFVLSGFLVGRLIFREYIRTNDFIYKRFFIRRAFKIWPLFYTFLAIMCVVSWERVDSFALQIGTHLQNFIPPSLATHLWSLAVEEHFYLIFGVAFAVASSRPKWVRFIPVVLVSLMFISPVLRVVGHLSGVGPTALQWQTQYRIDALAAGVALAWASVFSPVTFAKILRLRTAWMLVAACGYLFLAVIDRDSDLGVTLGYTVSYVAGAAVFLLVYKSDVDRILPRLSAVLASIGVYSYATYIWHVPIGRGWEMIAHRFFNGSSTATIIGSYTTALLICPLISLLVEMPALRLRDQLFPAQSRAV